jgi:DNA-binding transcriptional regulator YdaS (Cro superfamily)
MLGSYTRVFDDDEVLKLLHSSVKSAGGQIAFSKKTGVERSHLNMVLNGKRRLSPSIIDALNPRVVYAPVGRHPSARADD